MGFAPPWIVLVEREVMFYRGPDFLDHPFFSESLVNFGQLSWKVS
jgi:hypothetical protein